jgi:Bacterial conjugation TrbI-like protein
MNPANKIFLVVASLALSAGAPASARAGAQATGQAAGETTVSADKTHAQASGGAPASSLAGASQANAGLASGTAFNAALNSSLDSKKSKPGDAVAAHTTENVKSQDKTTIIPKGTKLVGHVTKSSARAKGDAESELAIVFDRAILKNGEEVPLHVAIQAMAAVPTTASAPDADLNTTGSVAGSGMDSGMGGSRGALGGAASTAGGAAGGVSNTGAAAGGAGDAVSRSTNSTTTGVAGSSRDAVGGLNPAGELTSNSRGMFSMNGLNLNSAASGGMEDSVITSAGKNVHLDSGTRMLMVTQASASVPPRP